MSQTEYFPRNYRLTNHIIWPFSLCNANYKKGYNLVYKKLVNTPTYNHSQLKAFPAA